ncbi:MAG TPA: hypothetical protein V6C91_02915 [Coleofasciculaceae cyanobacterium]
MENTEYACGNAGESVGKTGAKDKNCKLFGWDWEVETGNSTGKREKVKGRRENSSLPFP